MSRWQEHIDRFGRMPTVRSDGHDVTYVMRLSGGTMVDGFWSPPAGLRMLLRCTDDGEVFVDVAFVPVPRRFLR